ncbi:hypothetical protein HHX47_DHR1001013 [Lentinula edodes]|nr:hypothetical protein HHX47_DHR1001013 [Lentinula edodes]
MKVIGDCSMAIENPGAHDGRKEGGRLLAEYNRSNYLRDVETVAFAATSMSNAYDVRPAGSLKLKSTVNDGGIVKKKKKKSKGSNSTSNSERARERERVKELLLQDDLDPSSPGGSSRNSPAAGNGKPVKTEAERRFEEVQKQRLAQRVAKLANKTHKDRVNEFNSHLESLSEHHDIPKVGPG